MNGGALWPKLVLGGIAALLLAGLVQLFRARFATGDVYPKYSSLRGDPLGSRVYYEALDGAGIEVSRNFRDVARAALPRSTIYLPGLSWAQLRDSDTDDVKALLQAVRDGGRLVLGFAPSGGGTGEARAPAVKRASRDKVPVHSEKDPAVGLLRELAIDARWLPAGQDGSLEAVCVHDSGLPERFLWHSALSFEPEGDAWRRIYNVGRYAGIVERGYGSGTIVLVGDAFVLSNEAMARARQTALLAWLQGPHARAVFDETHLGVVENAGIAALARRYGLTHAALALIAVALLYLWKNGSSLVPPSRPFESASDAMEGRDASAGLVNLLQRTLPPGGMVAACVSEYKRSAPWRRLKPETQRALDGLALSTSPAPAGALAALRRAHELLKRKL